jgi:hypothetical protein
LKPGGLLVVGEWARERFDQATARRCFDRLPLATGDQNWLQDGRGQDIIRELRARSGSSATTYGPYHFPDLEGISEADEQAAIDSGEIQANRIDYVGRRRSRTAQAQEA